MKAEPKTREHAKALRKSMTKAEIILWSQLRRRALQGHHFRKQHPVGPYITDFACVKQKLVIEVDGETHATFAERSHDNRRTKYLESEGWHVHRVWNTDIYENLEGVLEGILNLFPPPLALLTPAQAGEEGIEPAVAVHNADQSLTECNNNSNEETTL